MQKQSNGAVIRTVNGLSDWPGRLPTMTPALLHYPGYSMYMALCQ